MHFCVCSDVQVLKKCLIVLAENSGFLKRKWTGNTSESFMHMIACITYYLSKVCTIFYTTFHHMYVPHIFLSCGDCF